MALALQWLHDLPAPPGHVGIGPLGNGLARHTLFKDCTAPLSFPSTQALDRYLDRVRPCLYFLSIRHPLIHDLGQAIMQILHWFRPAAPASISHERLVFTQSDMHMSNFGVNDKGMTCLFDFGEVGLLPESFASYTMSLTAPFTVDVARHLVWPSCSNLDSMSKIRRYLAILADPILGTSTCA